MIRFVSPTMDLLYNIFTSTDKKLRATEYENFLNCYYEQLSENIRKMGSDPDQLYPFEEFRKEFKKCVNFVFVVGPSLLRVSLTKPDECADLEQIKEGERVQIDLNSQGKLEFDERFCDFVQDLYNFEGFNKLSI